MDKFTAVDTKILCDWLALLVLNSGKLTAVELLLTRFYRC